MIIERTQKITSILGQITQTNEDRVLAHVASNLLPTARCFPPNFREFLNDSDEEFNYVRTGGNWDPIANKNAKKRAERESMDKEIDLRIARISSEQLNSEIQRLFSQIEKDAGNKRKRSSKAIREQAHQNLRKKIRLDVSNEFDRRFLQDNLPSDQVRDLLENQQNSDKFYSVLTNARMLLNE